MQMLVREPERWQCLSEEQAMEQLVMGFGLHVLAKDTLGYKAALSWAKWAKRARPWRLPAADIARWRCEVDVASHRATATELGGERYPLTGQSAGRQTWHERLGDVDGAGTLALNLSPAGNLAEAAANLFDMLHDADATTASLIGVAPVPADGLGEAINDRLRRAAAPRG